MSHAEQELAFIQTVVRAFYGKALEDDIIGYHFRKITQWDEHIRRTCQFWYQQIQKPLESQDTARPIGMHLISLHVGLKIRPGQLGRWYVLFNQVMEAHQPLDHTKALERLKRSIKTYKDIFEINPTLWQHPH